VAALNSSNPKSGSVFDNDGTLWSEQPMYFQLAFVLDRLKAMAPGHPEWKDNPLVAAVLAGDMKTVAAGGGYAEFSNLQQLPTLA
jgi:hypothetical protein